MARDVPAALGAWRPNVWNGCTRWREGYAPARPRGGGGIAPMCVWGGWGWEGGLASGRLTRSTRRREDTESGFEVGLCVDSSSSIRPLLGRTGTRPRSLIEGIVLFLGLQSIFRSEVSLSFRRGLLMRL